ncbi:MAG: DUF2029 domain-containing protein [Clostridia bacterium]|nr:DUF2029 domain-containing protein [Clostridia bacterium]
MKHIKNTVGFVKRKLIEPNPIAGIFALTVSISALIYFIIYLIVGNGSFVDIFFARGEDRFMDFFNSIRDASQGSAVYTEREVIYPPMANLIFLIMSRFTPVMYNNTGKFFGNHLKWGDHASATIIAFFFFTLCTLILFYTIFKLTKGTENQRFAFALVAVFSTPLLYMIERGNIIILCLISLVIYAGTYNSQSRFHRELGLIALAFSFSLKLYPVIFGWFLLVDKRFKDAIRCFIYGMIMLIVPSFFFGGPSCLVWVFANILGFSSSGGTGASALGIIAAYAHIPEKIATLLAYGWCLVCGLCLVISPYVHKDRWKSWLLGTLLILAVPSLTGIYSWAFIIIPLILLGNQTVDQKLEKKNCAYFILMLIPFLLIPGRLIGAVSNNQILAYIFTAALSIFLVIDTLLRFKDSIKESKAQGLGLIKYFKSKI